MKPFTTPAQIMQAITYRTAPGRVNTAILPGADAPKWFASGELDEPFTVESVGQPLEWREGLALHTPYDVVVQEGGVDCVWGAALRAISYTGSLLQVQHRRDNADVGEWFFPLHPAYNELVQRMFRRAQRSRTWSPEDLLQALLVFPEMDRKHGIMSRKLRLGETYLLGTILSRLPILTRKRGASRFTFKIVRSDAFFLHHLKETET